MKINFYNWKIVATLVLILSPALFFAYYTAFENWLLWFWAYQNILAFEIVSNLLLLPLGFLLLNKGNWQKASIKKLSVFVAVITALVLLLSILITIIGGKEKASLAVDNSSYHLIAGQESYFPLVLYKCAYANFFCSKIQALQH